MNLRVSRRSAEGVTRGACGRRSVREERPGLDSYAGPCEKPVGAHRGPSALVPSTLRGLNALRLRAWVVRQKEDDAAIFPRGVFELGRSNSLTSAGHGRHSCL